MTWRTLTLALALSAFAANAGIIFDNGDSQLLGGLLSSVDTHYIVADDFILDSGADILTDIHWWGYYSETPPTTDAFTVYLYSDAGGEPGTVLFTLTDPVFRTDTGNTAFGTYTEFEYHMDISAIDLAAGTTYWVGIQDDVDCNWFWSISDFSEGGDAHQKLQAWHNYEVEEAFYLTGPVSEVVPEPSSVMLMGIGLVALGFRKQARSALWRPKHN